MNLGKVMTFLFILPAFLFMSWITMNHTDADSAAAFKSTLQSYGLISSTKE